MQHSPDVTMALTRCTDQTQIGIAVNIIATSFTYDPAMVHFVGGAMPADTARHAIVDAITKAHFRAKEPIFLLRQNEHIIGAALVEVRRSTIREVISLMCTWRLWRRLPKGCIQRLNTYRLRARHGSNGTTIYLTMLAIHPDHQGKGLGRQFIEFLEREVDPKRGWSLDTETARNVVFYERLGYALVDTVDWEANTIYQMHKSGN